jgi:hypothetical protein
VRRRTRATHSPWGRPCIVGFLALGAASQKCDVALLRVVVQWLAFVDDVNGEEL